MQKKQTDIGCPGHTYTDLTKQTRLSAGLYLRTNVALSFTNPLLLSEKLGNF